MAAPPGDETSRAWRATRRSLVPVVYLDTPNTRPPGTDDMLSLYVAGELAPTCGAL